MISDVKANKGMARYGKWTESKGMARYVKWSQSKGTANADQVRYNRLAHEAGRPQCGLVEWWRECGGVGRSEDGFGPTLRSPPILLPMPVLVHTHPC